MFSSVRRFFWAKNISIVAIVKAKCKHYFLLFSSFLSLRYCYYPLGILFLRQCDFGLIECKKPSSFGSFPLKWLSILLSSFSKTRLDIKTSYSGFQISERSQCMITLPWPTIGDKIVETLYLNRVTLENKRIRTPPLSPPFKVGVFVVFYR